MHHIKIRVGNDDIGIASGTGHKAAVKAHAVEAQQNITPNKTHKIGQHLIDRASLADFRIGNTCKGGDLRLDALVIHRKYKLLKGKLRRFLHYAADYPDCTDLDDGINIRKACGFKVKSNEAVKISFPYFNRRRILVFRNFSCFE